MKNKKNVFLAISIYAIFVIAAFATSTTVVHSKPEARSQSVAKNIAMVFSTGKLGDLSFNDAANAGLKRAEASHNLSVDFVEPESVTEINTFIESFATSTDPVYDLIITIGFSAGEGLNASAFVHTEKNYVIIDSVTDLPNVASIVFREEEGSFLVGAMAAMTSRTGTVGFLGGLDIPLINRFRYGFAQGARYINPDIEVLNQYSPDASNPWGDVAGGKAVAKSFIADGADVIYAAAGGTGEGVFDAAVEAEDEGDEVYAIGVDSDQDYIQKGYILASMVKRVDVAVETQIDALVAGTWVNGTQSLGLAEDGVGISNMTHTDWVRNSECSDGKTRYETVQDIAADIKAGTITVVGTGQDTADYNTVAHECDKSAPRRNPTGIPGFELAFTLLGLFVVLVISQRKRKRNM